jgi:hypothetical protein
MDAAAQLVADRTASPQDDVISSCCCTFALIRVSRWGLVGAGRVERPA